MEKKKTIIVISIVLGIVIMVSLFIIFSGLLVNDSDYILLEVNPKIEFITNNNFEVTSFAPLNKEAKELVIQEDFLGLKADEACTKFVDLCAKAGYIDVDGEDNAVKISTVDGLTQALEVHIVSRLNEYFLQNEILCNIIENAHDLEEYNQAKKHSISSIPKYSIIKTIIDNNYSEKSISELSKMNEENHMATAQVGL